MNLLRIREAEPLEGLPLKLTLANGSVAVREVADLLVGPIFQQIRSDPASFAQVRVEGGTVVWQNGADLCPDVLIWGGPPPKAQSSEALPPPD